MPRPWYRSMLFWLGLPFPPFLAWLWWWSMQGGRGWMFVRPGRSVFFSHGGGTLRFGTDDASLKDTSATIDSWTWTLDNLDRIAWFQIPALERSAEDHSYVLVIPHWLAILLYVAAWIGALVAWQRHKRRCHAGGLPEIRENPDDRASLSEVSEPPPQVRGDR